MKMRQRRRHFYRRAAYDLRLREFTEALEQLADALLEEERVDIALPGNAQPSPAQAPHPAA